jgi:hypothetical protein
VRSAQVRAGTRLDDVAPERRPLDHVGPRRAEHEAAAGERAGAFAEHHVPGTRWSPAGGDEDVGDGRPRPARRQVGVVARPAGRRLRTGSRGDEPRRPSRDRDREQPAGGDVGELRAVVRPRGRAGARHRHEAALGLRARREVDAVVALERELRAVGRPRRRPDRVRRPEAPGHPQVGVRRAFRRQVGERRRTRPPRRRERPHRGGIPHLLRPAGARRVESARSGVREPRPVARPARPELAGVRPDVHDAVGAQVERPELHVVRVHAGEGDVRSVGRPDGPPVHRREDARGRRGRREGRQQERREHDELLHRPHRMSAGSGKHEGIVASL